jgi:uracil-DNA glycosylase family 4
MDESVRPVHGTGPEPCKLMLVGNEPGWKDMIRGKPFEGPVGAEVDRLLGRIGWPRERWYLTNYFRRPAPDKGVPHPQEDYEEAGHHLKLELERVQPKVIVPLGREAIRYFLGDVDVDEVWGLHLLPPSDVRARLPMLRPDVSVAPQVHPAAGFHSPESSNQVLVGFQQLGLILAGRIPVRGLHEDPIPDPLYRELRTVREFESWVRSADITRAASGVGEVTLANDTEGYPHAPWSIQLTLVPGEGVILRTPEVIEAFARWAREARPTLVFHSALHDARMNRIMTGIDILGEGFDVEDTMLMAYELGVIPQGLKALAVRECAMPMMGYQEVLGDAQERHTLRYLNELWGRENARYQRMRDEDFRFQKDILKRRIKVRPKLPKLPLMSAAERVLGSKDPYKLWNNQNDDILAGAYKVMRAEVPEASLSDVDPDLAIRYAGRDPDATLRVAHALLPRVKAMGLEPVYRLDMSTLPIIARMMDVGIKPDPEAFAKLSTLLDKELLVLQRKLADVTTWGDFNPNSGDQVAEYLYGVLGVEQQGKSTDSGRGSTNDKVLEALQRMYPEYPQIADIRSYREYHKLRWTFVERLPELVERWPFDQRIHCELMLNRTPSGRLAAKAPNLLAMPKHGKFAKAFRACFVPRDGCMFLSLDESQVELRVGAHLSQDPVMLAIYRGERRNPDGSVIDMHTNMCVRIYGRPEKNSGERTAAKAINFGYWMGQTHIGLVLELRKAGLDVDEDDAQRMINEANALYVGAGSYKQAMIAEAEKNGYVRCMSGRIRYVGGIRSKDPRVKAEAERFAYSTPIQEGAQYIGKQVLAAAWKEVYVPERRQGNYVEPLLWTHDDLLSEVDTRRILHVAPKLQEIMTRAPEGFSVPLETKPEAGLNWADMVEL